MIAKDLFQKATGHAPYPYQERLANEADLPQVLGVPTGLGKTAAVALSWLYRRRFASADVRSETPRRLIYCLPMRTLVEQTRDAIGGWLQNLGIERDMHDGVGLNILMGGNDDGDWYEHPERDAILIGTQDMLLSRALNRGYGMSRYAWPVQFALLNSDCLWVLDETQLMGVGLTTSAQLAGLRDKLQTYGISKTLWMSATLDATALATVDHPLPDEGSWSAVSLEADDVQHESVTRLLNASKPCEKASVDLSPDNKKAYAPALARLVVDKHVAGTLTLVVLNRVARAQELYQQVRKLVDKSETKPELALIHSRYRPIDRQKTQDAALDEATIPECGRIIIATQAIEAGVDISATTLVSELAPWSSMVQRFGRCNRRGLCGIDQNPAAHIYWVDIDTSEPKRVADLALPYELSALDTARDVLLRLDDGGPATLTRMEVDSPQPMVHVLRRKDLIDLFDTTPDLSGNDLDVSRYIRDSDDSDVQVYWREWDLKNKQKEGAPPLPKSDDGRVEFPAPTREELCSVSIAALRGNTGFVKKAAAKDCNAYAWDALTRSWQIVRPNSVRPGMMLLLHSRAGGYDTELGWTGDVKDSPVSDCRPEVGSLPEAMDADDLASDPVTVTQHLRDVGTQAERLRETFAEVLPEVPWPSIVRAAWWHDVGKVHPAFQGGVRDSNPDLDAAQAWAKSGKRGYLRYQIPPTQESDSDVIVKVKAERRRGFRHELASALAWLQQNAEAREVDLVAYLIAAHHGKVRLSIRSMHNENRPPESSRLFARGIWDGDSLPRVEIGNSAADVSEDIELSLDLMQLGEHSGTASWLARTVSLRDDYGPFRLAFLESLVRVADWRGSQQGASK